MNLPKGRVPKKTAIYPQKGDKGGWVGPQKWISKRGGGHITLVNSHQNGLLFSTDER